MLRSASTKTTTSEDVELLSPSPAGVPCSRSVSRFLPQVRSSRHRSGQHGPTGGISGKLYELGSGAGKSLLDVGPDVPGSDLVNIVEEAISRVSTLRGRLGALQKNVIDTNINSLGVALENISDARSAIVDTDFAASTAELTKAQILSQAGISVLSIANQNPSQVLSLLG